jgi:Na+/H+ antiporter NhaC
MSKRLRIIMAAILGGLLLFLLFAHPDRKAVLEVQGPHLLGKILKQTKLDQVRLNIQISSEELQKGRIGQAFRTALAGISKKKKSDENSDRLLELSSKGSQLILSEKGKVLGSQTLASFWSLLPPFLAILLAISLGQTIPALLMGVLFGAILVGGGPFSGLKVFVGKYIFHQALGEEFKLQILGFIVLLSTAVGLMTKAGGIEGLVLLVRRFAKTARSSQIVAWVMGLLIFFDDYANTIVVGSTMRPLLDRMKVSREKLAYIVDSTAAPVAGLSALSTWVAYEISQFSSRLPEVTAPNGLPYTQEMGFSVFLQTLPFRFYCIFTLFFVVATVLFKREFGPMLFAERRARRTGQVLRKGAKPMISAALTEAKMKEGAQARWELGLLPVLALLGVTIWQILSTGITSLQAAGTTTYGISDILGAADSSWAILMGATAAVILAALLPLLRGTLDLGEVLVTGIRSMRALWFAVVILVLAWCIGFVCDDLGTAHYLVAMTSNGFPAPLLPSILFLLACLIAFATGSSWSTMAILLPNVVLLAHNLGTASGFGGPALMVLSIGAVLEGSIFGDHCSPISDTTVLSSVASASDHLDHVQTQIPYASLTMVASLLFGYLPVAFLSPRLWPLCLVTGAAFLTFFLFFVGRNPDSPVAPES